jgi:hypothetical protein
MHSALAEILLEKSVEVERIKKRRLPGDIDNDVPVRRILRRHPRTGSHDQTSGSFISALQCCL